MRAPPALAGSAAAWLGTAVEGTLRAALAARWRASQRDEAVAAFRDVIAARLRWQPAATREAGVATVDRTRRGWTLVGWEGPDLARRAPLFERVGGRAGLEAA